MRSGLTSWLLCGLLGALPAVAAGVEGRVTRVSDGDTLWLRPDGGHRPFKVRLLGLDAPERCQAWGPQARRALAARALGQRVRLDEGPLDGHGRRLGRLWRGDEDLGGWLVRQGHAWNQQWQGRVGPYAAEEAEARRQRRGLFAAVDAVAPNEFRRRNGACPAPAAPSKRPR